MFKMSRVGMIMLVCVLSLSGLTQATVLMDRVVAVVNQDVITWSELYKTMEADASPKVRELQNDEKVKIFKENEASFLETLINVRLQLQEAKNIGIKVSDEELKEAIDNIRKKYAMSEDAFNESLKKEGFTFQEYKKRLQEQIIISKLVNTQIRNKIIITDEDLKKFVIENKAILENTEGYKISQIVFKKQEGVEKSKIEEKAGDVLKKIEQGEGFNDLAKKYSEDSSASVGGDLGLLKKSQLNDTFIDVISKMNPGEVSKPFWTESGLHIIKLESRTEAKNQDEQREAAKTMLINKIFTEKYNAWIKSLRERSFIEVRL